MNRTHPLIDDRLQIVSGGRWTINGRWVVVNPSGSIAFDPDNGQGMEDFDLADCWAFVRERGG